MDAQNYKNLSPKNFDFVKILKIHEKKIVNPLNVLLLFIEEITLKDLAIIKS